MKRHVTEKEFMDIVIEPCYYLLKGSACSVKSRICPFEGKGRYRCDLFYGKSTALEDKLAMEKDI